MISEKQFLARHRALPNGDRLRLAYHEAGHAVTARLLGVTVEYVTVGPRYGGKYDTDTNGHCQLARNDHPELDYAIMRVAANVAVELHLGLPENSHQKDAGEFYTQARASARELLETPAAREEVRLLAEKLLLEETVFSWEVKEVNDGPSNVDQAVG